MKRTTWVALGAALIALACGAPAAFADSIAYVNKTDGNVYLSTPDGSRQYQVTNTGGYSDVSQADDGTMIALKGVRLHKLSRDGQVLADFDTPVSDTRPAPSKTFYGPFDPAISPDGTKVAYTYYYMTQSQNPGCFPPTCVVAINEAGTGYSYSDRQTGWDEPGLGYHSGWRHPSWVDNDMTMISNPSHLPNRDIILDRISDGGNGHGNMVMNWTSDMADQNPHVSRRRHHARQAQARLPVGRERLDAHRVLRPRLPDRLEGRRPEHGRDPRLLPLRQARRAVPSACRRSPRTAARSPTTTVTASTSRPSRPSATTARWTARPRPRRWSSPTAPSPTGAPPTSRPPRTAQNTTERQHDTNTDQARAEGQGPLARPSARA